MSKVARRQRGRLLRMLQPKTELTFSEFKQVVEDKLRQTSWYDKDSVLNLRDDSNEYSITNIHCQDSSVLTILYIPSHQNFNQVFWLDRYLPSLKKHTMLCSTLQEGIDKVTIILGQLYKREENEYSYL